MDTNQNAHRHCLKNLEAGDRLGVQGESKWIIGKCVLKNQTAYGVTAVLNCLKIDFGDFLLASMMKRLE